MKRKEWNEKNHFFNGTISILPAEAVGMHFSTILIMNKIEIKSHLFKDCSHNKEQKL